jgi:hypothetical protein
MQKCELLVTEHGATMPVESIKALFPACGQDAVQQVQAASGELVWVCQKHYDKLMAKQKQTGEA